VVGHVANKLLFRVKIFIQQAFIAFAQQGYEGVSLRQLATIVA
jgi:hypothetical protein